MAEFNVAKALTDGYTEQEIADYLSQKTGFNASKAIADGYAPGEVIQHMVGLGQKPQQGNISDGNPNPKNNLSYGEEFAYVWDDSTTMTERAAQWMQSRFPLPGIQFGKDGKLLTLTDPSGSDVALEQAQFRNMSPDQRLEYIKNQHHQRALAENPEAAAVIASGGQVESGLAKFAREMADPASLLAPAGTGLRGMAMTSALYGAGYDVIQQYYDANKPYSAASTAVSAAVGGSLGGVMGAISSKAPALFRALRGRPSDDVIKQFDDMLPDFEQRFNDILASQADDAPIDVGAIKKQVAEEMDIDEETMHRMLLNTDREAALAQTPAAARNANMFHEQARLGGMGSDDKQGVFRDFVGTVGSRIKEIDPRLYGRMQEYELGVQMRAARDVEEVKPFLDNLRSPKWMLKKDEKRALEQALFNADFDTAKVIMGRHDPKMLENFSSVQSVLQRSLKEQQQAGIPVRELGNYFPRQVKDHNQFLKAIGKEGKSHLDHEKTRYAQQQGKKVWAQLSGEEQEDFMNMYLRGLKVGADGTTVRHARARAIEKVTDELQGQYHSAADALTLYLVSGAKNTEKYKFFGRDKMARDAGNRLDLNRSIGDIAAELELPAGQSEDLMRIIQARFGAGEQSPAKSAQLVRNLGYLATLANPFSAAIQIADLGVAKWMGGSGVVTAALKAAAPNKIAKNAVTLDDLGIGNLITEQLSDAAISVGKTARFLDRSLAASGFKFADRLGKETIINATLQADGSAARKVGSAAYEKLKRDWSDIYDENEWSLLVNDLANNRMTDRVKLHAWNRLSGAQPTSPLQMPLKYLEAPNGRLLYALKSFGLRQLNTVREEVKKEMDRGNSVGAARRFASYAFTVAGAGASVDFLRDAAVGTDIGVDDFPDYLAEGLMRLAFASPYSMSQMAEGRVGDTIANAVAPPLNIIDDIMKDMGDIVSGDFERPKSARNIPVAGKFYDLFFNGGLERENERRRGGSVASRTKSSKAY